MKRILLVSICTCAFIIACITISCKSDYLTPLDTAPKISFKNDIQPVLAANCSQSGCHGSVNPVSVPLITFTDISALTVSGDPHNSTFYKAITATSGKLMQVHTNHRLNDLKIKQVYVWIVQGANNN